jgi:sarcosine oxidase
VATWGGFVFLHLTPDEAAPLADQLGPVPERLRRYPLEALAVGRRLAYRVEANWKLVAENYNECYHCAGVHPELCRVVPAFRRGGGGLDWDRGIPHREGAWTFTATGRSDRAPFPALDDDERTRHKGELVYPNLMLSLSADHVAAFTLWPHGPAETTVVCELLFHPDEQARPGFDPSDAADFWDLVNRQDWAMCESAQRAWPRAPTPAAGSPPWSSPASTSAATSSGSWARTPDRSCWARPAGQGAAPLASWPLFDVVVVGLGALGSAAAWVLARAGARVLGLEQFELGHHRCASHDHARIIRRSYHTPAYVRLAGLAYRAWAELEWEAEERLVVTTGGLDLFPAGSAIPPGPYRSSLEACGVPYQWLDAAEVMRRWPAFRLDADVHGLWQADAGMVPAARATRLMQRLAAGYGAILLDQAPVTAVRDLGGRVEVATADATFPAGRVLLCADAWTGDLLAQLDAELPLIVSREQFSYFRPADAAAFAVGRFPVWIWMDDPSFYGFPVWPGSALKAAQDVGGRQVTATTRGFDPRPGRLRASGRVPARPPARRRRRPRPHRDLPVHPDPGPRPRPRPPARPRPRPGRPRRRPRLQVAPLLGRVLADLALHGGTDVDLSPFAPDRPALTAAEPKARYLV